MNALEFNRYQFFSKFNLSFDEIRNDWIEGNPKATSITIPGTGPPYETLSSLFSAAWGALCLCSSSSSSSSSSLLCWGCNSLGESELINALFSAIYSRLFDSL